ncbi:hypothetical protein HK405_006601 [Cladochytrium tenue]|nr:hypothetical protein HK405_006601 [Cladochytrium tenue]
MTGPASEDIAVKLAHALPWRRWAKVSFIIGAGMSHAAGLPMFRPGGRAYRSDLANVTEELFSANSARVSQSDRNRALSDLYRRCLAATPTLFHHFIAFLASRGALRTCYTQNFDMLEDKAEIPPDRVVHLHGVIGRVRCSTETCGLLPRPVTEEEDRQFANGEELVCPVCQSRGRVNNWGRLRHDVTLYYEHNRFEGEIEDRVKKDRAAVPSLLIVVGTSMAVPSTQQVFLDLTREYARRGAGRRYAPPVLLVDPNGEPPFLRGSCDIHLLGPAEVAAEVLARAYEIAEAKHMAGRLRRQSAAVERPQPNRDVHPAVAVKLAGHDLANVEAIPTDRPSPARNAALAARTGSTVVDACPPTDCRDTAIREDFTIVSVWTIAVAGISLFKAATAATTFGAAATTTTLVFAGAATAIRAAATTTTLAVAAGATTAIGATTATTTLAVAAGATTAIGATTATTALVVSGAGAAAFVFRAFYAHRHAGIVANAAEGPPPVTAKTDQQEVHKQAPATGQEVPPTPSGTRRTDAIGHTSWSNPHVSGSGLSGIGISRSPVAHIQTSVQLKRARPSLSPEEAPVRALPVKTSPRGGVASDQEADGGRYWQSDRAGEEYSGEYDDRVEGYDSGEDDNSVARYSDGAGEDSDSSYAEASDGADGDSSDGRHSVAGHGAAFLSGHGDDAGHRNNSHAHMGNVEGRPSEGNVDNGAIAGEDGGGGQRPVWRWMADGWDMALKQTLRFQAEAVRDQSHTIRSALMALISGHLATVQQPFVPAAGDFWNTTLWTRFIHGNTEAATVLSAANPAEQLAFHRFVRQRQQRQQQQQQEQQQQRPPPPDHGGPQSEERREFADTAFVAAAAAAPATMVAAPTAAVAAPAAAVAAAAAGPTDAVTAASAGATKGSPQSLCDRLTGRGRRGRLAYDQFLVHGRPQCTLSRDVDAIFYTSTLLDCAASAVSWYVCPRTAGRFDSIRRCTGIKWTSPDGVSRELSGISNICIGQFGNFKLYLFLPREAQDRWLADASRREKVLRDLYDRVLRPALVDEVTVRGMLLEYPLDFDTAVDRATDKSGFRNQGARLLPHDLAAGMWEGAMRNMHADLVPTFGDVFLHAQALNLKTILRADPDASGQVDILGLLRARVHDLAWDALDLQHLHIDVGLNAEPDDRNTMLVWRKGWARQYVQGLGFSSRSVAEYNFCLSGDLGGVTAKQNDRRAGTPWMALTRLYMREKSLLYSPNSSGVVAFSQKDVHDSTHKFAASTQTMKHVWELAARQQLTAGVRVEWRLQGSRCQELAAVLGAEADAVWPYPGSLFAIPTDLHMSWRGAVLDVVTVLAHTASIRDLPREALTKYLELVAKGLVSPPVIWPQIPVIEEARTNVRIRNFAFTNALNPWAG